MDLDLDSESKLVSISTQLTYRSDDSYLDEDEEEDEVESNEDYEEEDLCSESKLISLITKLLYVDYDNTNGGYLDKPHIIIQIISLVTSLDLVSELKPETEFMSLVSQAITLFKTMDLESQPKPLSEFISRYAELANSDSDPLDEDELISLNKETIALEPEPKLISLIYQILSLVNYMNSKDDNLIPVRLQARVELEDDNNLHIVEEFHLGSNSWYNKWKCLDTRMRRLLEVGGEGSTYFLCDSCNGHNHEEKATNGEITHPLHPKHSLKLVYLDYDRSKRRKCYCCDEYLSEFIYCCFACNFAMTMRCVVKQHLLSMTINHPKWHQHPLFLFSRTTSLICDICALVVDSTSPVYICPPCGFVVHQRCLSLPRVIKISRHPKHRIVLTLSFSQGNRSCGVCRKEINNDYGGYYCTKNDCLYAAHSECATQKNVWDGVDLDGVPEDDTEDVDPFVRISDGIIQHFSHSEHHMRLDENTERDYDDDKLCQACITPIYFGNLYACMLCDFILHERCANLPRKMYHPIHPHQLTLTQQDVGVERIRKECSACPWFCVVGLFYECRRCLFEVHVQCGVIEEPLVHASHTHPLFLTSKPGERKKCTVCKQSRRFCTNETFNCIECDFSLCFGCATLPQKLRYKHDKHSLILSYEKETSTMASWCEVCEGKINTEEGFYMCDEGCCVTVHIKCMIGKTYYMKPGSSWFLDDTRVDVVPNKQQMTRPICSYCKTRCLKASLQIFKTGRKVLEGSIFCSTYCIIYKRYDVRMTPKDLL